MFQAEKVNVKLLNTYDMLRALELFMLYKDALYQLQGGRLWQGGLL